MKPCFNAVCGLVLFSDLSPWSEDSTASARVVAADSPMLRKTADVTQARVLLSLKGKVDRSERELTPKDPGEFVYFDKEFSSAKVEAIGVFYVGTKDDPDLLLGYRVIQQ